MGAVLLETRKLSNSFGRVCTARELDLSFTEGILTSIIGPNGAGKSTLINLLTGQLPVQSGQVLFRGKDITRLPIHERIREGIGRSFQIVNVFPQLSVRENILIPVLARSGRSRRLFSTVSGEREARREAEELLSRVGLFEVRGTPAAALSHGDQRLLEVAVALAARPVLLFLDEPTAGMNPVERVRLLESIRDLARDEGTTFVLVEHDMDVVFSLSERIVVLHRGEVIGDGTPEQIRENARVREVYLGDEMRDVFHFQEAE